MNLKIKKKIIKKLLEEQNYANDVLIYKLLKKGHLDNLISKLDSKKTFCHFNCFIKKGYLTAEEQFLNLLDNFIIYLNNTFYMLEYTYIYMMLEEMLKSKYCNIFFTKHYWGDNNYLEKYRAEFNKIIIEPFIKNLTYLTNNHNTKTTRAIKNIITDENKINLNTKKSINETILFLKDILLYNPIHLHFTAMYLFINIQEHISSIQNKQPNINIQEKKEIQDSLLIFFDNTWTRLYENYLNKIQK